MKKVFLDTNVLLDFVTGREGMDEQQLQEALSVIVPDFEDMLQYVCAKEHGCDAIITRNKKDFIFSTLPLYTPTEFLQIPYYWTNDSNHTILNEPEIEYGHHE